MRKRGAWEPLFSKHLHSSFKKYCLKSWCVCVCVRATNISPEHIWTLTFLVPICQTTIKVQHVHWRRFRGDSKQTSTRDQNLKKCPPEIRTHHYKYHERNPNMAPRAVQGAIWTYFYVNFTLLRLILTCFSVKQWESHTKPTCFIDTVVFFTQKTRLFEGQCHTLPPLRIENDWGAEGIQGGNGEKRGRENHVKYTHFVTWHADCT